MSNTLFYGDNLEVLRQHVATESIDLCYIDPPFNSKRNYNQIYNNVGTEDRAQAQAFVDTWLWDDRAQEGFDHILSNEGGRFTAQTIDLIAGLQKVLKRGSLLAYLVSMALRVTEIQRVLKKTGSFYLHCDPTASHYLKLVLDAIFVPRGGNYRNEIVWGYESGGRAKKDFGRKHDVLLRYTKSATWLFNGDAVLLSRSATRKNNMKKGVDPDGRSFHSITSGGRTYKYYEDEGVIPSDVWVDLSHLQQKDPERLGYPTQKPEALLERIIRASSNESDTVLDAYCGCGTTVAVAQRLGRKWIGIDITYQSIALILRRLEGQFGSGVVAGTVLDGIPRDMDSATALAHKRDDRVRKEFEKWALMTYCNNRAIINEKKGADGGIDGVAYFQVSANDTAKIVLQVKSGNVQRGDIARLNSDRLREGAEMATLITLQEPTRPMLQEAKTFEPFRLEAYARSFPRVDIVTVRDILENGTRLDLPTSLEVLKSAQREKASGQRDLLEDAEA